MYKLFSRSLMQSLIDSISLCFQRNAATSQFNALGINRIMIVFQSIHLRWRAICTAMMLSALLTACGGGGGGGDTGVENTSPPSLTISTSRLSVDEDFTSTQTITIATNATGFTVDQSTTGVVKVTTTAAAIQLASILNVSGQTTLTITAVNGVLRTTTHVLVTVNAVNDPPTLTISTNAITTNGGFSTITINTTASDIENGALSFAVTESNTGVVTVTTSANAILLNAIANASGITTLTVGTADLAGVTVTQTILVNVLNDAPVLNVSTSRISVQEDFGNSVLIRVTATDADNDAISLSVSSSMRLVDAVISTLTGGVSTLSLTSLNNANGTATLTVHATDVGGQVTTAGIVVVIEPVNDTPTLSVSTIAFTLDEDFQTTRTVATAMDSDRDALNFSVFESSTGVVTVTTSALGVQISSIADANGSTTLTITVSDSLLSTTAQVVVAVTQVNDTPTLSVLTNPLILDEDFQTTNTVATAMDIDLDALTFSVIDSSAGVVTVTTSALGVQISSIGNANGVTTLTITVSDGRLSSTTDVAVQIRAINDPPVVTVSTTALTLNEDFASSVLIGTTRTDVDGDNLTLSVTESATGVVTVTTTAAGIQVARIENANGQTTLTISVGDSTTITQTQVVVTVTAVNDPPTLTVSTDAISTNGGFSTITILTDASDIENGALSFAVTESNTGVVTVTTSANAILLNAIANASGITTLSVRTADLSGATVTQTILINVLNDAPVLNVSSNRISVQEDFGNSVLIRVTATDADNDAISLSVSSSMRLVDAVISTLTGGVSTLSLTSLNNANGTATVTIHATDVGGQVTTAGIVVVVEPVNDTPTLSVLTNPLILDEDFQTTNTVATDIDRDVLNFSVIDSSAGVVTVTTSAFGVQISSIGNANGVTTLTITVSDGRLSSTTDVAVQIRAINDPPVVTVSTTALTLNEDFALSVLIVTTRTDVDGDNLTLSVTESATGVVTVTTTAAGIQVARIDHANGQTTLTISVSDSTTITQTQVVVTVTAVNDPPTLTVSTDAITTNGGFSTITINTTASDIENGALSFAVTESSTGVVTVTTSANAILLNAIANASGITTLSVRTDDLSGATVTQTILVNVLNDAPVLNVSSSRISVQEDFGNSVLIRVTATDADNDAISLSVSSSMRLVDAVLSTLTGGVSTLSLTSLNNANGTATLTVQATDTGGQVTTAGIVVVVEPVNDTPTLSVLTNPLILDEDFQTTNTVATAMDSDRDALNFSVIDSSAGVVTVTTSALGVQISSIGNANGVTTLTITVSDGRLSSTTDVAVQIRAINDPPVVTVSTTALTLNEDFASSVLIVTTRTDVDGDNLTLSVTESATGVVTVTTTTAGIQVARIENANGQTTLTISVSDSTTITLTQVVVTVTAVNDPPTLTVSSHSVSLDSAPIILDVSASDVEDRVLAFSVSTGQGVINTVITTTNLTITRLGINATEVTLIISVTDSSGATISTNVIVVPTPLLRVTTNVKTLNFAWSADSSATYYRLESEPMRGSGFTDLSTSGLVVSPSTTINQTTAQVLVALHRYIPRVNNPMYGVKTCDVTSCNASFKHNTVSFSNADLNNMIGRFNASNAEIIDQFGWAVSLSGDGNTLAVGANQEGSASAGAEDDNTVIGSGAVYVFRRNGGVWSQQAYIKASNPGMNDLFGRSISLSADGNTLAVGADQEDGSANGTNGVQTNTALDSGAVYVFRRNGGVWSQQAYIKASNTGAGDTFGESVSLSVDGNTLAVGAHQEDSISAGVNMAQNSNNSTNSGAVYVFRRNGGVWSQQAYIKASNSGAGDFFGESLSLSGDGDTLAVGAREEDGSANVVNGPKTNTVSNAGAAYVFRFNGTVWIEHSYIKASNVDLGDLFGKSVSLSRDGNTLAVGAIGESSISTQVNGTQINGSNDSGAVYLFRLDSSSNAWTQQAYIKAFNTGSNDQFGISVSLSNDGNVLAVGAYQEDGSATGVGGADNNNSTNEGATYVFEFNNGTWAHQAYVKTSDTTTDANFGFTVSLSNDGNSLAVGAYGVNALTGAVYLY